MPFKLYLDSRWKEDTPGSSDTDFRVQLPAPMQLKGKAIVDSILFANSFYTIRVGENDRIFVQENVAGSEYYRVLTLTEGQYNAISLRDELLAKLTAGKTIAGAYSVIFEQLSGRMKVSNDDSVSGFHIFPSELLKNDISLWNANSGAPQLDAKNLMDAAFVVGLQSGALLQANPSTNNNTVTFPDAVNCQPYHHLFLRSVGLGSGDDVSGNIPGSSDIIRRVIVSAPQNGINVDQHSLPYDSITIGEGREISSLSFRLTDFKGKVVDTRGHPLSFSIIFLDADE